jgi:poly(A) polymerase
MKRQTSLPRKFLLPMKHVKLLNSLAQKKKEKIYLVGGYLRDLLLKRPNKDLDFVLASLDPDGFTEFVGEFAERIKGTLFPLNDRYETHRVLDRKNGLRCDFTRMQGDSIEEDLARRDFTINALALDLKRPVLSSIIDPHKGKEDIRKEIIRVVGNQSFTRDPIRLLRSIRFRAALNFKLEKKTRTLIMRQAQLLQKAARERIREELFGILALKESYKFIRELDDLKLLTQIFPEIEILRRIDQEGFHHLNLWEHSCQTLKHTEEILNTLKRLFPKFHNRISRHLDQEVADKHSRRILLKLAALFHDLGKPETGSITPEGRMRFIGHEEKGAQLVEGMGKRLRFSRKATEILKKEVLYHMRPGNLSQVPQLTNRAIFRFFRDCKEEGIETLLLSYGDRLAARGPLGTAGMVKRHKAVVGKMLAGYYETKFICQPKRLVNGDEIMVRFKLAPGPKIGELLEALTEAQVERKVTTKREALKFIERKLKN